MRNSKHAKIVATLGPASSDKEMIKKLVLAGVNVFRLNFSHGSHDDHRERYDTIREVEQELNRPIGILQDLQGPKLRLGTFKDGKVSLTKGDTFTLTNKPVDGDNTIVTLPHPEIIQAVEAGQMLLLDDGKMRLNIESVTEDTITTTVLVDGTLSDRKGVNVPGAVLPISALTEKDLKDLDFGLELGVDWVALSFVQRVEDVLQGKEIIKGRAGLLAKLEKPSAVTPESLPAIVAECDAIMVARGDLGVELPPEEVPMLQKRIVRESRKQGRPVIVATQMLESMIDAPAPTRAEVTDVSNAVLEGADAVMLSAESAAGKYPLESVGMMTRIINSVESDSIYTQAMQSHDAPDGSGSDAISLACSQIASSQDAVIASFSRTGGTVYRMARFRSGNAIVGLTPDIRVARRLALVWGVLPILADEITSADEMVSSCLAILKAQNLCKSGDQVLITAGAPFGVPGSTNLLRMETV